MGKRLIGRKFLVLNWRREVTTSCFQGDGKCNIRKQWLKRCVR